MKTPFQKSKIIAVELMTGAEPAQQRRCQRQHEREEECVFMVNFEEAYASRKANIEERAADLARMLMQQGRQEDILRAAQDVKFREKLYREMKG